jgi:hypothetical protein
MTRTHEHKNEFYLLGSYTVQFSISQPTFWRNISPPSSGLNSKPSKKAARSRSRAFCWLPTRLTLQPWRWRQYIPPKHHLNFIELHDITFQKTELFVVSVVRMQIQHEYKILLQAERLWVWFPMRALDFSTDPILPALGSTQSPTEMSTRYLPGGKADLAAICEPTV